MNEANANTSARVGLDAVSYPDSAVVQLVSGDARKGGMVVEVQAATVRVTSSDIIAGDGATAWVWPAQQICELIHAADDSWTIIVLDDKTDFGVKVPAEFAMQFRRLLDELVQRHATVTLSDDTPVAGIAQPVPVPNSPLSGLAGLDAREISAWFGSRQVLDRVSLHMPAGKVTSLIGPSGCGKSTFLRILNRMHEMIPSASLAGEVLLDGHDIYDPQRKLTDARREIGMVFQKPNPFPAMSIYDNVIASLRLTGTKATQATKDELVEGCLTKAGLWNEVKDRLRAPGGGLSGGQQQRLCIARALAIKPRVLLMDEPCSALDPTSTRRIEETIIELASEVTIVIVTHNMQQAARVSDHCAFFLASQGTPGVIVEHGPTAAMFGSPQDDRTLDYVTGRFG